MLEKGKGLRAYLEYLLVISLHAVHRWVKVYTYLLILPPPVGLWVFWAKLTLLGALEVIFPVQLSM